LTLDTCARDNQQMAVVASAPEPWKALRLVVTFAGLLAAACGRLGFDSLPPPYGDGGGSDASAAVNGHCGRADGVGAVAAPTAGLCSGGTASAVAGSGPWTWTCAGVSGGVTASCSAPARASSVSCTSLTLPAEAQAVDTSSPTTVVGTGTAASCTFDALTAAVSQGGIITFDCGDAPVTIPVTSSLTPPTSSGGTPVHTVIDGGNRIILDGGGAVRLIYWDHASSWAISDDTLTLQRLALRGGKATPTRAVPVCTQTPNDQCPTGFEDGAGGALYMRDGLLRVIDCTFTDNQAALLGPTTGGGAIYVFGARTAHIANSTFTGNRGSNAGGVQLQWAGGSIFNSLFDGNSAVGQGACSDDPAHCACMHDGMHEVGSGGNGGAIHKDGRDDLDVTLCGVEIRNSTANEFGSAVFLTADGSAAKLIILDSLMTNNTSPISYWNWCPGVSTDNAYASGSSTCSPNPVNTRFCDRSGTCTSTCD
jgi:hypothetical protein